MGSTYRWLSNVQGAVIGNFLQSTNGLVLEEGIRLGFEVTNNEAKYEAFIYGLKLARHLNIRKLEVRGNLVVVIGQITGVYEVNEPRLKKYFDKALAFAKCFKQIEIQ